MKGEIKVILEENNNGEVSLEMVWDALKAVVGENYIFLCTQKEGKTIKIIQIKQRTKRA